MAKLIVFAGLPASGKSTIARQVAARTGALWLRVDAMDQAIWASGTAPADLRDWTYRAAQALASDNLALGHDVIADCVNDWQEARNGWDEAAKCGGASVVWIELVCSDSAEHRRRVETRGGDIPGFVPPSWDAVMTRDYHAWDRDHVSIDTAHQSVENCVAAVVAALQIDIR